jgi:hypothetical protein
MRNPPSIPGGLSPDKRLRLGAMSLRRALLGRCSPGGVPTQAPTLAPEQLLHMRLDCLRKT